MRTFISFLVTMAIVATAQAGDRPFKDFKYMLGDESFTGTQGQDVTCQVESKWLENGDLEITATSQYKKGKPSVYKAIFSDSKKVDYTIHHFENDESEYILEQSTPITTDPNDHDPRDLFESLTVYADEAGYMVLSLSVMEVNEHSDPSEVFHLNCEL